MKFMVFERGAPTHSRQTNNQLHLSTHLSELGRLITMGFFVLALAACNAWIPFFTSDSSTTTPFPTRETNIQTVSGKISITGALIRTLTLTTVEIYKHTDNVMHTENVQMVFRNPAHGGEVGFLVLAQNLKTGMLQNKPGVESQFEAVYQEKQGDKYVYVFSGTKGYLELAAVGNTLNGKFEFTAEPVLPVGTTSPITVIGSFEGVKVSP